eukprot:962001-Prorocentrum_minimum.AAC.1
MLRGEARRRASRLSQSEAPIAPAVGWRPCPGRWPRSRSPLRRPTARREGRIYPPRGQRRRRRRA